MRTKACVLALLTLGSASSITARPRAAEPAGRPRANPSGEFQEEPPPATSSKPRLELASWFRGNGTENPLWVRNPDAARWALDGMLGVGLELPAAEAAMDVNLAGRFAFVPGLSIGGSIAYQRGGDSGDYPREYHSEVFPGAFLEAHVSPDFPVDLWLRATGGIGIEAERNPRYDDYRSERSARTVRGFCDVALGISMGSRHYRLGPFVAVGHRRLGIGLRFDVLFPVERRGRRALDSGGARSR